MNLFYFSLPVNEILNIQSFRWKMSNEFSFSEGLLFIITINCYELVICVVTITNIHIISKLSKPRGKL